MAFFNILKAILVRVILLLHTLICIWRVAAVYDNEYYYLLAIGTLPFILEGIYTAVKRKGIEWKWFCPCFVCYLCATLPGVWLLEVDRTLKFGNDNSTTANYTDIIGIKVPFNLGSDTWVLVIEESLLYGMIIGRWLLPRGQVSRGQLSELLFTFIGIASDIMEFFALFEEVPVRKSMTLTYAVLGIWSWSLFQFPMVLTVASRPIRVNLIEQDSKIICIEPDNNGASLEVLATMVSLLMQDGPFLAMRLYTMVSFKIVNYTLLFFTTKNVLVILLLLYRMIAKGADHCCPEGDLTSKTKHRYKQSKVDPTYVIKDEIIAALLSDANTVRNRRLKKKPRNNSVLSNARNLVDLVDSDISIESIIPHEIPTIDSVDESATSHMNDTNHTNNVSLIMDTDNGGIQTGSDDNIWTSLNNIPVFPQTHASIKQLDQLSDESYSTPM